MNNPIREVRESLARLEQLRVADLAATRNELTTLHGALRKEVEAQTAVVNAVDSNDPAYHHAASDLVELLQLTQAAADAKTRLDKLMVSVGEAVSRVLKKAPK